METRQFQIQKNDNKQKKPKYRKFNTQLLINDKKIQEQYKNKIQGRINNNQDINWGEIKSIMCDTAAELLGFQKKRNKRLKINP